MKERTCRPENIRPKMSLQDRAKQFAPFAALGKLDATLAYIEGQIDTGDPQHVTDLSDFSAEQIEEMLNEQ